MRGRLYQLMRPADSLAPFIEHYWHVHAGLDTPFQLAVDVFVDLRPDLVFNFGVPYLRTVAGGEERAPTRSKTTWVPAPATDSAM
jgi:hypothetical protein